MPKFVFSRTLTQAGWNTTVIHGVEFRILVHPVVLGQGRPLFEAPGVRTDSGSRERGRSATAWFCSTTRATAPKGPTRCAAPSNLLGWPRTSKN
jgi:hypothetical protein